MEGKVSGSSCLKNNVLYDLSAFLVILLTFDYLLKALVHIRSYGSQGFDIETQLLWAELCSQQVCMWKTEMERCTYAKATVMPETHQAHV